jgi:hypothetical protein
MAVTEDAVGRAETRNVRRPPITRAGTYSPFGEKTSLPEISTSSRASCASAFSSRSM